MRIPVHDSSLEALEACANTGKTPFSSEQERVHEKKHPSNHQSGMPGLVQAS